MFEKRQKPVTKFFYSSGKLALFVLLLLLVVIWSKQNLMGVNTWIYEQIYRASLSQMPLRLGNDNDAPKMVQTTRSISHEEYPKVLAMRLDTDSLHRTVMSGGDYTPQDIAVYIKHLRDKGLKALALSSPLQWDLKSDDMGLQSLEMIIKQMPFYTLGLRAQTAAMADFTPEEIAHSVISLDHVKGDISALPSANKCMPHALNNEQALNWAVDSIVGERIMENPSLGSNKCYPLLVRWNGEIYPTLPLKLAIDILGISNKDIFVELGKTLQLGNRSLPIDDFGRSTLPEVSHREILLEDFVDGKVDENLAGQIMLIEHQPDGTRSNQARLGSLADTLSLLLATQRVEAIAEQQLEQVLVLRSASWQKHKMLYITFFTLLVFWVLMMPLLSRGFLYFCYLILIPLISGALLYWSHSNGLWLNWSCIIGVCIVLLLFSPLHWKKMKKRR